MASIRDDAIHLAELDRRVVKVVIEWKPDELAKAIGAYELGSKKRTPST